MSDDCRIIRGNDGLLWPLFFDTHPRLDPKPSPADVLHASGVTDIVEVSVAV